MRRAKCRTTDILAGSIRALPVLAVPLSVLLLEAWMHLNIYAHGYTSGAMNQEIRRVVSRIEELKAREAELERMDRMDIAAPELGLVLPQPSQVHLVKVKTEELESVLEQPFDIARRDNRRPAGAALP